MNYAVAYSEAGRVALWQRYVSLSSDLKLIRDRRLWNHLLQDGQTLRDPSLERRLHLLGFHAIETLNLGRHELGIVLGLDLLDEGLFLVSAACGILDNALGFELIFHEFFQSLVGSRLLVVRARLSGFGGEIFHGRVSADAVFRASGLVDGAVDVGDNHRGGVCVRLSELVPVRLHSLAVAAPRSEKFDEHILSAVREGVGEGVVGQVHNGLRTECGESKR
mmetsp:Transcript_1076/g.1855  ORF Transcript_1076/g.1855 Transcript_1076/m.1855 type:complete len:221 (-) Transcript_1076:95-757(-)